jgi:hypothetical protein
MRFAVPQFIDVEDKIFGPLTFRQFIYLTGGAGLAFLSFKLLPIYAGLPLAAGCAGLAFGLAFVRINEKPLINLIEAAFNYFISDKLYIWKHEKTLAKTSEEKKSEQDTVAPRYLPRISESKLHDIAWGLDVLDKR